MEEEEEDIIADYTLTLEDLTSNSKPHINALTILAEENQKEADKIVMAIESRLKEVFSFVSNFNHLLNCF